MTITTKATAKVAAVAAGLAMATSMLSLAPLAHAQTPAAAATCTITMSLTVGSTGAEVICLQAALVAKGYLVMPVGVSMGYFGGLTKSAVAKWQAANGIAPAVGYFGPISRAAFVGGAVSGNFPAGCTSAAGFSTTTGQSCAAMPSLPAGCTSTVGFSPTTGVACSSSSTSTAGLTGAGTLSAISTLGDLTTDLKEGSDAMNVVGVSAKATGGDVAIQRVDTVLTVGSSGSQSSNINKYISDVSVYLDGKKLGSIDPALGSKDGRVWTFRFSGLNGVIKSGTTGNIYIKVTPIASVGTTEDGYGFTATIPVDGVRGVAADGISDTYVSTAITTSGITVSSVTAATLTTSPNSSNPTASVVAVSSSTTTGVTLAVFDAKAKNQGVTIHDVKASFYTSDAINDVYSTVKLVKGVGSTGTVLSSKTVTGTGNYATATFDSIDQSVAKDETVTYSIIADLKGDSAYADNTTILASTTVAGWDVEDADGGTVTPSAAVAGNTQTLTATGLAVTLGTATAVVNSAAYSGGLDAATFSIPFTVKAGDTAIWIGGNTTATTSTAGKTGTGFATQLGVVFATTTSSTATSTAGSLTGSIASADGYGASSLDANSNFYVGPNSTRTFTLTQSFGAKSTNTPNTGVKIGLMLRGINYAISNTMATVYYKSNLTTFRTPEVFIYKH